MLGTALDIKRWLLRDRDTPFADRMQRDRAIGEGIAAATDDAKVMAWWIAISPDDANGLGERLEMLRSLSTAVLFVLGLVMGSALAGVAFGYQGDYPVNLFALLGVLVGIPFVLLVFTVMLLPARMPAFARALSGLNVGRWVGVWLDRVCEMQVFAAMPGPGSQAPFARWQLVVFTQWLAVGYFVGVIGIAWLLVVFTDLAFGWSTTLELGAESVHRWFLVLATPWAAWLGVAVPDLTLVEASRFFRLEEGGMPISRVEQLGQWWPYVVMVILVYGLVPRLALLGVATWRLRAAIGSLLRDDPEVTALLDRLATPNVSFDETETPVPLAEDAIDAAPSALAPGDAAGVVIWNDALTPGAAADWIAKHLGIAPPPVVSVNVMQSVGEHQAAVTATDDANRLIVFVKGWEPPMLEFSDFLDTVRATKGRETSLMIVPIDVAGADVVEADRTVWARSLGRADGRTYVVGP